MRMAAAIGMSNLSPSISRNAGFAARLSARWSMLSCPPPPPPKASRPPAAPPSSAAPSFPAPRKPPSSSPSWSGSSSSHSSPSGTAVPHPRGCSHWQWYASSFKSPSSASPSSNCERRDGSWRCGEPSLFGRRPRFRSREKKIVPVGVTHCFHMRHFPTVCASRIRMAHSAASVAFCDLRPPPARSSVPRFTAACARTSTRASARVREKREKREQERERERGEGDRVCACVRHCA